MAVTYVIRFEVIPHQVDVFMQLLGRVLDAMRHESTFREAILHRDPNVAHRFMLYETWESHDDVLEVQLHRPYRQAWHDSLPTLLSQPRDISVWQPMQADRR